MYNLNRQLRWNASLLKFVIEKWRYSCRYNFYCYEYLINIETLHCRFRDAKVTPLLIAFSL